MDNIAVYRHDILKIKKIIQLSSQQASAVILLLVLLFLTRHIAINKPQNCSSVKNQ